MSKRFLTAFVILLEILISLTSIEIPSASKASQIASFVIVSKTLNRFVSVDSGMLAANPENVIFKLLDVNGGCYGSMVWDRGMNLNFLRNEIWR